MQSIPDHTRTTPQFDLITSTISRWTPNFTPGPTWYSFEQLRTARSTTLEGIGANMVGTVQTKTGLYRILRDEDWQRILGLASDVYRMKSGITLIVKAAKVVAKHRDAESLAVLIESVSMLSESNVLPERDGHGNFVITEEEAAQHAAAGDDMAELSIPRPKL